MTTITRETIIKDSLFLTGQSTNNYDGTNKVKYDNIFNYLRRELIAKFQLACTLREDVVLNSAEEKDWYLVPTELVCYFNMNIPKDVRQKSYTLGNNLEYRTEIKLNDNKISYYADTEYLETLPIQFIILLKFRFCEEISLAVIQTRPQLFQVFGLKAKEAAVELNAFKISNEKGIGNSAKNIHHKGYGTGGVY